MKMVHNGIEYADMQLIAEAYLLLKYAGGFTNRELADVFTEWNKGELKSYLIGITAGIFREKDDFTDGELVDYILDSAGQKGTGRWTSLESLKQGINVSMITAACNARIMSNRISERNAARELFAGPMQNLVPDKAAFQEKVRKGLYTAKIAAYAQGFDLLSHASSEYGWDLDYGKIASIFRAGCIIQAEFLDDITKAAKQVKPTSMILGEVWEDASNKMAYGQRRRYLLGKQLDSVMNYPFREAIIGFLTGKNPAEMMELIMTVLEHYPPSAIHLLMNHIGTHDTERILTVLGGEPLNGRDREWQSKTKLSQEQRSKGLALLKLASLMQYTLPGIPCVYYGDEAGMEGYRDPFNRVCFPWGHEDAELVNWYRSLGKIRHSCEVLKQGTLEPYYADDDCFVYVRSDEAVGQKLLVAVNRTAQRKQLCMVQEWETASALLGKAVWNGTLTLEPYGYALLFSGK